MAKIISTDLVSPSDLTSQQADWVYNGKDATITSEVFEVLEPQLTNQTRSTYEFSKSLQAPILEMRVRGIKIDKSRRDEVCEQFYESLCLLEANLYHIVGEALDIWDWKWGNSKDLQRIFYEVLGIPIIRKGGRPTCDRDALEKLDGYYQARPIVAHILAMRDLQKKISMLRTDVDPDGRIRTSLNIAGTSTGRLSSSFSEFGTGTNLQNIEEALRSVFVADPGYKLAYIDTKQGESYCVGAIEWDLFQDGTYLDACEDGDLHTNVAKLCWPSLGWKNIPSIDKGIAERPFYRHYSYRFMCKKIGHGTNYGGQPRTISDQTKLNQQIIEQFQPKYFKAFPAHTRWHEWVRHQLWTEGNLTTLTGRLRWFFGRRNDDAVIREAIAYSPQGSLADIVNSGMLQVWRANNCHLLLQIHDAILIQYPEDKEDEVIPRVQKQMEFPIELNHGRELLIPTDCKTGWNWGAYDEETNPDGLKSYEPGDKRKRQAPTPILDRVIQRPRRKLRI